MKDLLTRTIKSISRISTITLTNKRTFCVITAGIDMTWVGQTFVNVQKKIKITKNKQLAEMYKTLNTLMKDLLTRTIKSISRKPTITLTNKRTFVVSTASIDMTWVAQAFINVQKKQQK